MERAADYTPLADLAQALEEIDALSMAGLSRNHNTPVESELLALRAAVSRASVSLRKIEFWLLPATRASLTPVPDGDGSRVVPESLRRAVVVFRRPMPAETDDQQHRSE